MPKHQEYRGNRRQRRTVVDSPMVPMHTCPSCGKQAYQTRKDAKYMGKKMHQGQKIRLHKCRNGNTKENWHVTTMGAWATMRYKDYAASGQKPYEVWEEDDSEDY